MKTNLTGNCQRPGTAHPVAGDDHPRGIADRLVDFGVARQFLVLVNILLLLGSITFVPEISLFPPELFYGK